MIQRNDGLHRTSVYESKSKPSADAVAKTTTIVTNLDISSTEMIIDITVSDGADARLEFFKYPDHHAKEIFAPRLCIKSFGRHRPPAGQYSFP